MSNYPTLFSPITLGGLTLNNRITMAPMYLGYAGTDGEVNSKLLEHYQAMGASGAAMVMVENVAVDPVGMGSPFTLRVDHDRFIPGLARLARTVKAGGALAGLQINHAGRFARVDSPLAPSESTFGDHTARAMSPEDISASVAAFAQAARRAREAGFDLVELHGGTGYLLAQFLSPHTNRRDDAYGGPLQGRLRFPLEVIAAVRESVGWGYPVGYRYLADEWLPDGWQLGEAREAAPDLAAAGLAYLSVMGGTYESFYLPERKEQEKSPGYMLDLAQAVKGAVDIPVIAAGRIQTPELAEKALAEGRCDLIGLARVLFADPLWPRKAREGRTGEIVPCEPHCQLCWQRVSKGQPLVCSQWPAQKREHFQERD